jgi:molybdopterin synthase sulfur carrier subunit
MLLNVDGLPPGRCWTPEPLAVGCPRFNDRPQPSFSLERLLVRIKLYATLRLKAGQPEIEVRAGPGDTVRDAIRQLLEQHPVLAPNVLSEQGELVDHVQVMLNGRNVRLLDGLDTLLQEGQKLDVFPPIAGGRGLLSSYTQAVV